MTGEKLKTAFEEAGIPPVNAAEILGISNWRAFIFGMSPTGVVHTLGLSARCTHTIPTPSCVQLGVGNLFYADSFLNCDKNNLKSPIDGKKYLMAKI